MTAPACIGGSDGHTYGLTPKAVELLGVIRDWIGRYGYPPTYAVMAFECELGSKSSVARLIHQLERRGLVRRIKGVRQSVMPVEAGARITLPDDVDGILRAAAKHAGRTPSEHAAVLIRDNCPPLQPF